MVHYYERCKYRHHSHMIFTNLVVLHVLVGTILQQHHSSLHVVYSRGPVKSRFTYGGGKEEGCL